MSNEDLCVLGCDDEHIDKYIPAFRMDLPVLLPLAGWTARHYISQDDNVYNHCRENFRFHKLIIYVFVAQYHAFTRGCEVGKNQHGVFAPGERSQH